MPDLPVAADGTVDLSVNATHADIIVARAPVAVPVETSFGAMTDRPAVFLRLTDAEGAVGLGEVWCNFPACGAEHRARLLETAILPALLGHAHADPAACFAALSARFARLAVQAAEPGPVAQCLAGVDLALWDLVARRAGMPLYRLLGGSDPAMRVYASGINPDGAAATAGRCRDAGHTAFKLKIGFGRDRDLANVAAIAGALRSEDRFMVDANQAWTPAQAAAMAAELGRYRLDWLEEPVMADTPPEIWRRLAADGSIPFAGGENVAGKAAFEDVIDGGWFAVVQPDLCKWGGFSGCVPVARRTLAAGLRYCPHYLGGGIGLAASAHALAAVGGDGLLEIDCNPNPLRADLFAPRVEAGRIVLDDAPGLGIPADALDRLADFHSARIEVAASARSAAQ